MSIATMTLRWIFVWEAVFTAVAVTALGQSSMCWSTYKIADGLAAPVFDSISFTPQGNLVASRVNGQQISELEGYSVSNYPAPPDAVGRVSTSPGGQHWAIGLNGLFELKGAGWQLHLIPELKPAFRPGITPYLPIRQGSVLILLPDALLEFMGENPGTPHTLSILGAGEGGIGEYNSMASSPADGLWLCGKRGLARATGPVRNLATNSIWQSFLPPESLQLGGLEHVMPDYQGGVILLAENAFTHLPQVVTFDGRNWAALPAGRHFFGAWRGPDRSIWAATATALFEWMPGRTNWVEHEEISAGQIYDVAIEPDGPFWLATSDGLFRGTLSMWSKPEAAQDLNLPVEHMVSEHGGGLYFIAGSQLHLLRDRLHSQYPLPAAGPAPAVANDLFPLPDDSMLITIGDELFQFKPVSGKFSSVSVPYRGNAKPLGTLPDGSVCLWIGSEHPVFCIYDGVQFHPLANPPDAVSPADSFSSLFNTRNGDLWLAGAHGPRWRHNGVWTSFDSTARNAPESAVGFVEMPDGKIWCATRDELWQFDGANWSMFPTRFNHVNALMRGRDGGIWLASNGGLFRFCSGAWVENGAEEGMPNGPVTALSEDLQGRTWVANAHGLVICHPAADTSAPRTYVRWFGGESHRLVEGDKLSLLFEGQDKWKESPRERLLYSFELDQHGWSGYRDLTMFTLADVPPGRHHFQVRAMDRSGNVDPVTAVLDFTVVMPWYREGRLWVVSLLGLAVALFFAGVAWNRHRQLLRSYAAVELKVAERTRELEIATRELLHSQKMNALGTLAAGIAHDFNNILSIIKGSAQIIEDNTDQPEKILTRVSRIKTVVQQGAEIVDAMLGFGRGPDTVPAPCDINAVVSDTIRLLGDRFQREVEVKFERGEGLPELSVARDFIQQILINFIFNAAEAMNERKQITVVSQIANALPAELVLSPDPAAVFIFVSVRDRGTGISPEVKPRIFEPFFTTKALSTRRGTGLGLSMVYELAKRMGAGLALVSAVGAGSTFTLILPVPSTSAAGKLVQPTVESVSL